MHTVEMLEAALRLAGQMGYSVRHEWLGGSGGGICEFNGRKWVFVDLALTVPEQLEEVAEALRSDPLVYTMEIDPALEQTLELRRAA
jgi:hypothetical protein